jgi:predicted  nucleic acid-binding Zn-ribbon protein
MFGKIAAVIVALTTIIGTAWTLDKRWAYRCDVTELSQSFRKFQVEQSIDKTTDRIWSTEDRLKKQPTNEELQQQKRELEERKRRLEHQLQQIEKGGS